MIAGAVAKCIMYRRTEDQKVWDLQLMPTGGHVCMIRKVTIYAASVHPAMIGAYNDTREKEDGCVLFKVIRCHV